MSKLYSPEKGALLGLDGIQFKTSLGYATFYGQLYCMRSVNGMFTKMFNVKGLNSGNCWDKINFHIRNN